MGIKTRLGKGGRLVIPARFRAALSLQPGDPVLLELETGEVRLIPLKQAITAAQQQVRRYVSADTSLVEALLQDRRAEAARE